MIEQIIGDLVDPNQEAARMLCMRLARFQQNWRALWACFSHYRDGYPAFQSALYDLRANLEEFRGRLTLSDGTDAVTAIEQRLLQSALEPVSLSSAFMAQAPALQPSVVGVFDRPIFIVAAPRSGSSLLLETLARTVNAFTIGDESHEIVEQIALHSLGLHNNMLVRLDAGHATPRVIDRLQRSTWDRLRNRKGGFPASGATVRLLERKHNNVSRIPFLATAFPGARFIYLYREPHESLASIVEAWLSKRFVTHAHLPDWPGPPWSLILIPGWQHMKGKSLTEIAAAQWSYANQQIMDDLAMLPSEQWCAVSYDQFLASPQSSITQLCHFADLTWDQTLGREALPLSRHTLTRPDSGKWRRHAETIEPLLPRLQPIARRARQLCYAPSASGSVVKAMERTPGTGTFAR